MQPRELIRPNLHPITKCTVNEGLLHTLPNYSCLLSLSSSCVNVIYFHILGNPTFHLFKWPLSYDLTMPHTHLSIFSLLIKIKMDRYLDFPFGLCSCRRETSLSVLPLCLRLSSTMALLMSVPCISLLSTTSVFPTSTFPHWCIVLPFTDSSSFYKDGKTLIGFHLYVLFLANPPLSLIFFLRSLFSPICRPGCYSFCFGMLCCLNTTLVWLCLGV